MTIQSAIAFIRQGQQDPNLRTCLVKTTDKENLDALLAEHAFHFSPAEFEEAYSLTLFKCQEQDQAQALMAFRMWWHLLVRSVEPTLAPQPFKKGAPHDHPN